MFYDNIAISTELNIDRIHFIDSFDYEHNIPSAHRTGHFWELLYAESGAVNACIETNQYVLSKTCFLLRSPDESVRLHLTGSHPTRLTAIGFDCTCAALNELTGKPVSIVPTLRRLLLHLVTEAQSDASAAFAAKQLVVLYLHLLLIHLIRGEHSDITLTTAPFIQKLQSDEELFQSVISYMEEHIREHLTIDRICHDNLIGRGQLQKMFSTHADCGIIDYFSLMKINAAKQLIRENNMNFSQIAEYLGYNSIHYFSRHFKNLTGFTPTEYAARIRTL